MTPEEKSMGMIIYRKKSMKLFEFEICQSKFYQAIICKLDNVSVCFVCMNGFEKIHLGRIQQKVHELSNDDKLQVISRQKVKKLVIFLLKY